MYHRFLADRAEDEADCFYSRMFPDGLDNVPEAGPEDFFGLFSDSDDTGAHTNPFVGHNATHDRSGQQMLPASAPPQNNLHARSNFSGQQTFSVSAIPQNRLHGRSVPGLNPISDTQQQWATAAVPKNVPITQSHSGDRETIPHSAAYGNPSPSLVVPMNDAVHNLPSYTNKQPDKYQEAYFRQTHPRGHRSSEVEFHEGEPDTGTGTRRIVDSTSSTINYVFHGASVADLSNVSVLPAGSEAQRDSVDGTNDPAAAENNSEDEPEVLGDFSFIQTHGIKLHYENFGDVLKEDEGLLFTCPENDESIPETNEEQRAHAQELVAAFLNNTGTIEEKGNKTFKHRWADGATYYERIQIERQAWRFFAHTYDLHKNGWSFPIEDHELRDSIWKTRHYTFAERWETMLKLFSKSKGNCDAGLKGEKLWSIIGNAAGILSTVKSNKKSNDRRAQKLKEARQNKNTTGIEAEKGPSQKKSRRKGKKSAQKENSGLTQIMLASSTTVNNSAGTTEEEAQQQASTLLAPIAASSGPTASVSHLLAPTDTQQGWAQRPADTNGFQALGTGQLYTSDHNSMSQVYGTAAMDSRTTCAINATYKSASTGAANTRKRSHDQVDDDSDTKDTVRPKRACKTTGAQPAADSATAPEEDALTQPKRRARSSRTAKKAPRKSK